MPTRHRKSTRTRYIVIATALLGVLGAGVAGVASAKTNDGRGHHARPVAGPALGPATTAAERYRPRPTRPTARPTRPTSPPPATTAPTSPPTTEPPTTAPTTEPPATTPPTTTPPVTTVPPTTTPAGDPIIAAALAHINAARTSAGLTPYTLGAQLTRAAQAHTALMAGGCGLSHQCPGEAGLGERFSAAGVAWRSAGENVGQGNATADQARIIAAANGLTDLMLAEVPPNDGHRRNLLNPGFTRIGLAVARDAGGKVWYTQDFVN